MQRSGRHRSRGCVCPCLPYPRPATGPDNIPLSAILNIGEKALPSLSKIFSASVRHSHFPEAWKVSRVSVIAKPNKSDYASLSSFRPISVVNSLARILEKVLLNRLTWLSKKHRWFRENQHGFLDGRSTETATHSLISFVERGFKTK